MNYKRGLARKVSFAILASMMRFLVFILCLFSCVAKAQTVLLSGTYTDSLPPSPTCTYFVTKDVTLQGKLYLNGIKFLCKSEVYRDKKLPPRVLGTNIRLCKANITLENCTLASADGGMWGGIYLADSSSRLRFLQSKLQDSYHGIVQSHEKSQVLAEQSEFRDNYVSLQLAGNRDTVRHCVFTSKPSRLKMPFDSVAANDYYYSWAHIKNTKNAELYLNAKQFSLNLFLNGIYGVYVNGRHRLYLEENAFYWHKIAAIYHQNGDLQLLNSNEIHLPIFTESTPQMQKERRKQKNDDSTTYGIYASNASVYLSGRNIFNSSQNVQTPTKSHRFKHIGLYGENCRPVTTSGENAFLRLQTAIQLQGGKGNKYTLSKNYFYNCRAAIHLNKTDSVERFLSLEMGCNEFVKDCNTSSLPQPTFYGLIIEGNSLVNGVYHTLGLSSGYKYEQNIGIAGNEVKANVNSVRVPKNMLLYVPENFVFISNRCQYQGEGSTLHYTRYAHENVGLVKSENTAIQDDMSLSIINNNGCMDSNSLDIPNADLPIILSTKPILYQNYPNPFGQSTVIRYALPETMEVPSDLQLVVIEPVSGKRLHSIAVTAMAGSLELNIEGLASGVYLYALTSQGSILATKKMVIAK